MLNLLLVCLIYDLKFGDWRKADVHVMYRLFSRLIYHLKFGDWRKADVHVMYRLFSRLIYHLKFGDWRKADVHVMYRLFSRYVIATMLLEENSRSVSLACFVHPPSFVHFFIVICVSRDWLKTTFI